nr:NB-ARC domain-containing protein [Streptomyces sp. NBC_00899]
MDAPVRYSILGTVRVERSGTELEPGPPKRLALLSMLLLRAPGPLTLGEAVDLLWDADPPPSAVNVVHRHIGALRRMLEPRLHSRTKAEHLVRAADGYRLLVDASTSDLLRFRELRSQAQLAARAGNPAEAAATFVEALGLWRGPVVAAGTSVAHHPAFTAVGREYAATAKEAADVVLAAAPALAEDVLTALRRAAEYHPFDEAIHARTIAALAATGRQAEALRQFESIRRTLADELGVEPGAGLRAAQQRLLRRSAAREPLPADGPSQVHPAQLPARPAFFAGRGESVNRFLALVADEGGSSAATTVAVCGMPGVGKTTLALHFAHLVADRFPAGQIHLDLRGYHPSLPPLDPAAAMRHVLGALGVAGSSRVSAAELGSRYRAALAGRRLLLVLDNARDCEQARPLLPGTPGSLAIVTSRRRLEGLAVTDNARVAVLPPMTRHEGVELLGRRMGADRVQAELRAAEEFVDLCGGLPLALAVGGARAALRPYFPLAAFVAQVRDNKDTLAAFASHDARTDVRSVFSWSYDALSSGAAALFRLLSLHPSADITVPAAISLAGAEPATTREHLAELLGHHLLVEQVPGRYSCPGLLRTYAAEMFGALDDPEIRSEAQARMFAYRLHSAEAPRPPLVARVERRTGRSAG